MSEILFGISVTEPAQLAALPEEYRKQFEMLKITAPVWESAEWKRLAKRKMRGVELFLDDAADRTLCRMAPEMAVKLQLDFASRFAACCREAAEQNFCAVSAGFDFDRMMIDSIYRARLLQLLRSLAGVLEEADIVLLLQTRLPQLPGTPGIAAVAELLRELPGGRYRMIAEMRPHEPAFASLPPEVLRPIRFELESLDVVYEPGTGNRLTAKHLKEHLDCAGAFGRPVRVFFTPAGMESDSLAPEIAALALLAAELRQKKG